MTSPSEIVSEEQVQKALDYLRDSAEEIGRLTRDARFAETWVKVVKSRIMKEHGAFPLGAQEREALASKEVEVAYREESTTAGELAKDKAMREAAAMKIEVWRTQSSNFRSMKL